MRGRYLAIVLVAMVALSGCAALDDGGSGDNTGETDAADAEFSQDVRFSWAAITGEEVAVEVTVENTGSEEGTHEAKLQADGETVTSESVTVAEGATETVTLTHTFDETGEHDLAVGDDQRTLTVYESPTDLFLGADFDQGTRVSEELTNGSGVFVQDGSEYDVTIEESATIRTNYDEETKYTVTEGTTEVLGQTNEETTEEWIVDGTRYAKIEDQDDGTVEYEQGPSDEFENDSEFSDEVARQYLTVEKTDGEYVFTIDPQTSGEATEFWAASSDEEDISAESITALTMEFRLDAELYRPTSTSIDLRLENFEQFSTLDMTITEEIVSYGEPVEVEVPEEVRENA